MKSNFVVGNIEVLIDLKEMGFKKVIALGLVFTRSHFYSMDSAFVNQLSN